MSGRQCRSAGTLVAVVMIMASAAGLATGPSASAAGLARTARAGPVTAAGAWRLQPSPDITTPSGALASVSCVTTRACTAVGSYVNPVGLSVTLAEAWNGTSWRKQPAPSPAGGTNLQLTGVSCTAANACEAVGSYIVRGGQARAGLAERWNGRTWSLQSLPPPAGGSVDVEPAAVSCVSAVFCELVGQYRDSSGGPAPLAEVWNGTSWQQQPFAGQTGLALAGVSCLSATFCEAVGQGSPSGQDAAVWNGGSWSFQSTPAPSRAVGVALFAVSCVAPDACIAVGDFLAGGGEAPTAFTLAEAWNGNAWVVQPTPSPRMMPNSDLAAVSCTSARLCTAVGGNFDPLSATSVTLAEQWNGTSWRVLPTPRTPTAGFTELDGVSCAAPNACEAVGIFEQASFAALAEAWNGTIWTIQRGVAPGGAINNFLFAVSCVTARFCEAVGEALDRTGRDIALAEAWNGTTWTIQPTPDPAKQANIRALLNGVSCPSKRFCAAVGQSNALPSLFTELWNGTHWTIRTAPGNGALTSVSCPSVNFCAAVGGTIAVTGGTAQADVWNGRSWSAVPVAPGFTSLTSVSCVSATFCEAVGTGSPGNNAQVWNGISWSVQATPLPAGASPQNVNFSGVSCPAPNACETVGSYITGTFQSATLAEAWNGKAWAIQRTPSPKPSLGPSLSAVSCSSARSCAAVGVIGTSGTGQTLAETWDGTSWRLEATPTPHAGTGGGALAGVWCGSRLACTAVGFASDAGGIPATLVEARSG